MAKRARVTQTYVSRVELGWQKLTVENMLLLGGIVGLNISVLLVGDDPRGSDPRPPAITPLATPP